MKNNSLNKFLLKLLIPYKGIIILMIFSAIYWALFSSFSSYVVREIINILASLDNIKIGLSIKKIFYILIDPITRYFFIGITGIIFFRICDYLINVKAIPKLRATIIKKLFNHILKFDYKYFKKNDSQKLCEKINDLQDYFIELLRLIFERILENIITLFFACFIIFYYKMTACALIMVFWIIFFMTYSILKSESLGIVSKEFIKKSVKTKSLINDIFLNILSVKLFINYNQEIIKSNHLIDLTHENEKKMSLEFSKIWFIYSVTFIIVNFLCIYFMLNYYILGEISIGDFSLLWSLNGLIVSTLWKITIDYLNIIKYYSKIKSAYDLIVIDIENININLISNKKININYGKIKFNNISFKYTSTDYLFKNLNLEIKAGEKVAFVGYSGSGKTSLINLILKIFKVESGFIEIDNQNIDECSNDSIYENISFIPQSPLLFKRSIRENIMYGKLNATEKEFQQSLKNANIDTFINNLKHGADTIIGGGREILLSGGQQQRIIIARAFLKNSPILILDEATSSLDSLTEMHIQESLKKLMINKTVIIVAHRLSTIMNMDRIIVFDKGKIIEEGSHQVLLSKENGLYKKLWNTQTNGLSVDLKNNINK